ncbi:MAG TPA: type VI secretion system Vgr family protein [Telluria sp.]|nr:type VI secretion system Vgr family protein [Telluria sp.]
MDLDFNLVDLLDVFKRLGSDNRPLRLRLALADGTRDDLLLPQRVMGNEAICGGFSFHILCVADDAMLPLKDFIGAPAELQIVTDAGHLRSICGLVAGASSGESDGSLATYELLLTDALSVMEHRINTRVFREMNELDVISTLVQEWQERIVNLRGVFELDIDTALAGQALPTREFIFQHNESDAGFIRRLLKRRGIAWRFQAGAPGPDLPGGLKRPDKPLHTLCLFDDPLRLPRSAAGTVYYQRDHASLEHDAITGWCAQRRLQPARVTRHSWDHEDVDGRDFMLSEASSSMDQGMLGSSLSAQLDAYLVEPPHSADDPDDQARQTASRLARHELESKHFKAEGTVRSLAVGEWVVIDGHPELDRHPPDQREFVITSQEIVASNNLPKELGERIERLFADSGWNSGGYAVFRQQEPLRYLTRFTCVRRGVRLVADYDARRDLPRPALQSAVVVGPAPGQVWCDDLGRVKIRFPATRMTDHRHAGGTGALDADADSAWVRVASHWSGGGPGNLSQNGALSLPRVGTEVLVDFLGGDPDKPIIIGQLYNNAAPPPAFSRSGELPGNSALSGLRSCEIGGARGNQLRLDDTPSQISAQLASDHAASELNLGYLTEPRFDGSAAPRGEGAELRSAGAVALRGAKGVLISAGNDNARQLARANLVGTATDLHGATTELSNIGAQHDIECASGEALDELLDKARDWDAGSNVDPAGEHGGAPIVAASGDAGVIVTSSQSVLLGARTSVDVASVGDVQATAGRGLFLRAARSLQMFAAKLGIRLIAGAGDVRIESHSGEVVITSSRKIRLIAANGISLEAPTLQFIAQDARTDYEDGKILTQSTGQQTFKCSEFVCMGPGSSQLSQPTSASPEVEHDQQIRMVDAVSGQPLANRRYRIKVEDGQQFEGTTDARGMTERMTSQLAFARYEIEVLDEEA